MRGMAVARDSPCSKPDGGDDDDGDDAGDDGD